MSKVCCSGSFIPSLNSFFYVLKARLLLKLAAKVIVKELFTRIWIASLVEVPVLFSSGRKVLYCWLPLDEFGTSCCFPQGGKSSICIVRWCSTSLECRAVFLAEKSLLFESFVAARRVWNVVPLSSLRKDFVCLSSLNWTSCLTSRCSKNLERRAVFSRESILLFVLLIVARRIWNVVPFS